MKGWLGLAATTATVAAICFALLQVAGRIAFAQLPGLQGAINGALAARGVVVEGLRGRWQGLNPGVYVDRLRLPEGELRGIDFELDVLESLGRNRLVARRLTVADGHLTLEKGRAGWQLAGSAGDGEFDAFAFLAHSDEVWLHGRLMLRNGNERAVLRIESMLVNQDDEHRFQVHLQTASDCADCALTLTGDVPVRGPGRVRVAARQLALSRQLLDVLGWSRSVATSPYHELHLEVTAEGDWQRRTDGDEELVLAVDMAASRTTGAAARLALSMAAWGSDGGYSGSIDQFVLESADERAGIDGGQFRLSFGEVGPVVDVWLPKLSLGGVLAPLVANVGTEHPSGLWLSKVSPKGSILDFIMRFDAEGFAFAGAGVDGELAGHRGVPTTNWTTFALGGHGTAMRLDWRSEDFDLGFPGYIAAQGPYQRGGGRLALTRSASGYIGVRGEDLWAEIDGSRVDATLAVARPSNHDEVRVAADARFDRMGVVEARGYLPQGLAAGLREWLLGAVEAGELRNGRIVYRGHARTRVGLPLRRLEMSAGLNDGRIDYHPDWPAASAIDGHLHVAAEETRAAGTARAFDAPLEAFAIRVPHRGDHLQLTLNGETGVDNLIAFAWATPVHEAMPFLSDAWEGSGQVRFAADIAVPIRHGTLQPGDVQLNLHFTDAALDLADLGLHFETVDKEVSFEFPATLAGVATQGSLFNAPARISVASDDRAIRFSVVGSATPEDAYALLGIDDLGIAAGRFDFEAAFTVFPASDRAPELHVESDLGGLRVQLPPPLGKTAEETRPSVAALQFLEPHVAVSASYGDASGWLHVDDGILAGAVGIGAPVPMIDADLRRVVVGGGVDALDAGAVAALIGDEADGTAFAWELRDFHLGELALGAARFADVAIDGFSEQDEVSFAVQSEDLVGRASRKAEAPWRIDVQRLNLPAAADAGDPLDLELQDLLVSADLTLERVMVGEEDYGSWQFGVRPDERGVAFVDVVADVRGLRIESLAGAADSPDGGHFFWSKANETRFVGDVSAGNLQEVLPLWDFAGSVVSESFRFNGELRWPGSPVNFDLAHLTGNAELELHNGSFLDMAGGGTRIMSLLNFSTIVKRMSLDFSDVFGKGVSFDRVLANLTVQDGLARFASPGKITSTGSTFLISGTVDLDQGDLNNELVVTLPLLNSNLPWYAAFLAFSNPAGAAGVWLGREVFKNQIKRLSSTKYRIGGTYYEPEVELVGIFDNDIDLVPEADAEGVAEGAIHTAEER